MDKNTERYYEEFKNAEIDYEKLEQAEKKAENLGEHSHSFMLMLAMIKDVLNGTWKLNKLDLAALVGAVIYVISPVDAIPDVLPFVGWLDDISLIAYMAMKYADLLKSYEQATEVQKCLKR